MTDREQQIYAACKYTNQKGYPPSVRELGMVVIASTCTMHHYLHRIKDKA